MAFLRPGQVFVLATLLTGSMSAWGMSKSIKITPIDDSQVTAAADNPVVETPSTVNTNNNTGVSRVGEYYSFDGVVDIFAIGPKTAIVEGAGEDAVVQVLPEEGFTKERCQGNKNCIAFKWHPFVRLANDVSEEVTYRVHRATTPKGFISTKYTETATPEFVDTDIEPGKTYYYQIRVAFSRTLANGKVMNNQSALPSHAPFTSFKVVAPPANMAYVSRWSVNQEICGLMHRPVDPANNFRCEFNGAGAVFADGTPCVNNNGSYPYVGQEKCYYDIGRDYMVDRFAMGAAPTYADQNGEGACSWHGMTPSTKDQSQFTFDCVGHNSPNNLKVVPAKAGVVFFDRYNKAFYVATERDWGVGAERLYWKPLQTQDKVITNKAHQLAQSFNFKQNDAFNVCQANQVTVDGTPYQGRLLRQNEAFAFAAFDEKNVGEIDGITVPSLDALEHSGNYGLCHTQTSHGVIPNNNYVKGSETLQNFAYELRHSFQTGSTATKNCVSKYGVQDLIGNGSYYLGEQVREGGQVADASEEVTYEKFPSDVAASLLASFKFDNVFFPAPVEGPITYVPVKNYPYYNVALGLPVICAEEGACAPDDKLVSFAGAEDAQVKDLDPRGGTFFLSTIDRDHAMLGGCAGYNDGTSCGRYSAVVSAVPSLDKGYAVRCVFPLE